MASLDIKVKSPKRTAKKFIVEIDKEKFERLAANFGFFSYEFLESLELAEKDYRTGQTKKIKSLKELR